MTNSDVTALEGDKILQAIVIRNCLNGGTQRFLTRWLFVCIGGDPRTEWAQQVGIVRDEAGYLITGPHLLNGHHTPPRGWPLDRDPYYLETNVPGLFAAGDVRHGSLKRCASAVGEGAMAIAFVHRYIAGR
jgi:thioredoxin reductase (NADPH)